MQPHLSDIRRIRLPEDLGILPPFCMPDRQSWQGRLRVFPSLKMRGWCNSLKRFIYLMKRLIERVVHF